MLGKEQLILVRIWEGLGNQLFQYAYARALQEQGLNVKLDLKKAYDEVFPKNSKYTRRQNGIQNFNISIGNIDVEKYGKYQYIRRNNMKNKIIYHLANHGLWKYKYCEQDGYFYDKKYVHIRGNCYVKGWFQSESYFVHIRNELLRELTPKKKIRIPKELRQALENNESVAVHVRRGDYVKLRQNASVSYYIRAIKHIEKYYANPQFLFFSDDIEWVKKNIKIDSKCFYVSEEMRLQDYEELLIMSRCKSNIISNSTFSWWGAWLNQNPEKIIIAPKNCWLSMKANVIYM